MLFNNSVIFASCRLTFANCWLIFVWIPCGQDETADAATATGPTVNIIPDSARQTSWSVAGDWLNRANSNTGSYHAGIG